MRKGSANTHKGMVRFCQELALSPDPPIGLVGLLKSGWVV
jgi:hypothetical protein